MQFAALFALLIVAAVLAVVALAAASQPEKAGARPDPAPLLPAATEPVEGPVEQISRPSRLLLAVNETGAWRTSVGACPGGPLTLEYTTDGGVTWNPSVTAGNLGASSILAVRRGPEGRILAVGQGAPDCVPQMISSNARADKWSQVAGVELEWYPAPGVPNSVNSPHGVLSTPCATVVAVQPAVEPAVGVLCDDQRFFRSADGGTSWDEGIQIPGARSVTLSADGYLLAKVGNPRCAGVQLAIVYPQTAPGDGDSAGCRQTAADTTSVSLSVAGDALWLWVGDEVAVTADRGATWNTGGA